MAQAIEFNYISVNGENHIADKAVCRYINSLEDELEKAQEEHQRYVASVSADIEKQAERIALNLASGMSEEQSCLKHSLNHFTDTRDGEPVFKYRDEVMTRIRLALQGRTAKGEVYTR